MSDAPSFDFTAFADMPILDGHTHVWANLDPGLLWQTLTHTGARCCNALSLSQAPAGNPSTLNAQALRFKQLSQGRAFAFGALDYSPVRLTADDLVAQAQQLDAQGFDGIKMWEGKPVMYVNLPDRLEGALYAPYWAWMEKRGMPITLHMADPLRFWDPARVGLERWSYVGANYPTREDMFAETERILNRHPRLKIIFAHFLFFWDDVPRAARFLDAHPSVAFDLAPGIAGYFELSQNVDAAREFFLRYQDRLIYGTDVGAGPVVDPTVPFELGRESGQAWLVRAFLETDWDIPLPAGVGAVTMAFTGKRLRGMALPRAALEKIYWENFARMVGQAPRSIHL
ncbi:MAG: amidohydrolase family protein [Chloroflexi bacterium]|nr:amidohydrolase family protein [Chloroflexota bacterium]